MWCKVVKKMYGVHGGFDGDLWSETKRRDMAGYCKELQRDCRCVNSFFILFLSIKRHKHSVLGRSLVQVGSMVDGPVKSTFAHGVHRWIDFLHVQILLLEELTQADYHQSSCPLCEIEEESLEHSLTKCSLVKPLWQIVCSSWEGYLHRCNCPLLYRSPIWVLYQCSFITAWSF